MTIRLLCFPSVLGHKEKEGLAQTRPSTDVRPHLLPVHAKSEPYIILQLKEGGEERLHHTLTLEGDAKQCGLVFALNM